MNVFKWLISFYFFYCFTALEISANENPVFSALTSEDGLSQDYITAVSQDRYGFIWLGSQEGLNKWDGLKFTSFLNNPSDDSSISHDYISALLSDKSGTLWIGTLGGGLNIFDRHQQSFHRFSGFTPNAALKLDNIRALYQSDDGRIWVGTEADGIYVIDVESKIIQHLLAGGASVGLTSSKIRDIKADRQGRIWIATADAGVNMWDKDNQRFIDFRHQGANEETLPSDKISSLHPMQDGTIWVGTYESGLAIINPHQRTVTSIRHSPDNFYSLANDHVRAIFQDSDGRIWVGTDAGLDLWDSDFRGFLHFEHDVASKYSLTDNRVTSITQDQGGVIWVGTFAGVNKWNATLGSFEHIKRVEKAPSSLSSNIVIAIADSPSGTVWIGTWGGGLNRFEPSTQTFQHFMPSKQPGALSDARVMSVLVDSQERLWVGTMRGGLNVRLPESEHFTVYQHDNKNTSSISHNGITRIFEDSRNNIWVATFGGGVNLYQNGEFKHFRYEPNNNNTLSSDKVLGISEGPQGNIWFATIDGVSYYSIKDQKVYRLSSELPTKLDVIAILATSDALWIGTKDKGLLKVELNSSDQSITKITHFNRQNGLYSNNIFGILIDDSGMIWISSNKGLSAIAPETGKVTNFSINHGLQGAEFNAGAYHKGYDGSLYFGGNNGLNRFNPRHLLLSINQYQPQVVLTDFSVLNKPKKLNHPLVDLESIELDYFENFISFEFASLDYTHPKKNKYQYRLLGLQKQWTQPTERNQASFTNLVSGEYTFEVKGSNDAGLWSEPIAIKVSIASPPWLSFPAYLLYAASVFMLIAFIFYRLRQSGNQRIERKYNQQLKNYLQCLNAASDGVAIINHQGRCSYQNQSFKALFNIEGQKPVYESQALFGSAEKNDIVIATVLKEGYWQGISELYRGHEKVIINLGLTKVIVNEKEPYSIIAIAHDVTEAKHSEEELKRYRDRLEALVQKRTHELEEEITKQQKAEEKLTISLKEKEVLLKEVHHRVKNNMQVISSLLNMQANSKDNPELSELLSESQNRIRSMSLIHESLYQSENFFEIDFNDYIHLLVGTLSRVYSSSTYGIEICIDAENVYLDIDTAVPCGLIINELVSNAYKHAFKGFDGDGKVVIEMKSTDDQYQLKVSDNGVGFDEEVDFRHTTSLGMEIVFILTEQIKGSINLHRKLGSSIVIEFPKNTANKE